MEKPTNIKKSTFDEIDDTHRSYYENNPDYIEVNEPIEKVLAVLEKYAPKHRKTPKACQKSST
jgi:hypothetical protein